MRNQRIFSALQKLKVPTGWVGELLEEQDLNVEPFRVDEKYQRDLSPSYLAKGGKFNLAMYTPIVVCKRPDSFGDDAGIFVIDGQHRRYRAMHSGYTKEHTLPVLVHTHSEDITLEEAIKFEATMFHSMNTLGKKPSKLDEVRAGIHSGDETALRILDVLQVLNLQCDCFGSEDEDSPNVEVFNQFFYLCTLDYKTGVNKIKNGWALYQRLFASQIEKTNECNAYMLRACCLMDEFMEKLTNGKRKGFEEYLNTIWCRRSVKAIVRGFATMQSPTFILNAAIDDYNTYECWKTIGADLITTLSNKVTGGNPRFRVPV